MSKYDTIKAIEQELNRLNSTIDLCIIRGVSYKQESRRHRLLVRARERLQGHSGFFTRLSKSFGVFF